MGKHILHLRKHAVGHHEAHQKLKYLLGLPMRKEKVWNTFAAVFLITLISITLYGNWGRVVDFFTPAHPPPPPQTEGAKKGMLSFYRLEKEAADLYEKHLGGIPAAGHKLGISWASYLGYETGGQAIIFPKDTLKNSLWLANNLATGQFLTKLEQARAHGMQKSILATYYLGEKTVEMESALTNDTQLLAAMNNALSVDLFQYLNQSADRAATLDNYTELLRILTAKADARISELQSKINFLKANAASKESQIIQSENAFFENLKIFNGPNAEEELARFTGLGESQVEVKAKLGAYQSLQNYYKFFLPKLENLSRTISANRDALIAGVKVTEIQNMSLPLIIRQR
ncbi:hypothetical protein JXA05_03200 [Candidatus Peregrinibacteria bacterium]|nr:hypothetical protein [Candidatus Peregrinibacteria bacterium]